MFELEIGMGEFCAHCLGQDGIIFQMHQSIKQTFRQGFDGFGRQRVSVSVVVAPGTWVPLFGDAV